MKRILMVLGFAAAAGVAAPGCGPDKADNKSPKMVQPGENADKIGPATIGGAGGGDAKGGKGGKKTDNSGAAKSAVD